MNATNPLLTPFKPTRSNPFDHIKAAHLLNRAGFSGTPEEIEKVVKLGPEEAVDWLLDFPNKPAEEQEDKGPDLSKIDEYPADFNQMRKLYLNKSREERILIRQKMMRANRQAMQQIVLWWLERMVKHTNPLQEKLTLFWHGHFTTSASDERMALLIWNQNELLRKNAAGNFREFVRQISRDPAMLDYLNNQQNRKGKPNENYARELLELFTLGIGSYTEKDIKEAARAFTGWHHDGDQYFFRKRLHDEGWKKFMGKGGKFDGDDIIDIIMKQPQCGWYVASRLWNFFVHEKPDPAAMRQLGSMLRIRKYELRPVIKTMLTSNGFYDRKVIGSQIKSPIQLVVGAMRLLDVDRPLDRSFGLLRRGLQNMGQVPLYPPNVKGWPGGRAWINTSTLLARYNTCIWMAGGATPKTGKPFWDKMIDANERTPFNAQVDANTPEAVVDYWVHRLIQRPIDNDKKRQLLKTLDGKIKDTRKLRGMVQLIVSMPEYQLC